MEHFKVLRDSSMKFFVRILVYLVISFVVGFIWSFAWFDKGWMFAPPEFTQNFFPYLFPEECSRRPLSCTDNGIWFFVFFLVTLIGEVLNVLRVHKNAKVQKLIANHQK
jgi:hypothetical protein